MSLDDGISYNRTRHQSLRRTKKKFVIYDDFETNPVTGVTTILGQHVICTAEELILTGFNVAPMPDESGTDAGAAEPLSGTLRRPKKVRRTLLTKLFSRSRSRKSSKTNKPKIEMFVNQKAVWSMNPYEPIVPETKGQYDASRRCFWIMASCMFFALAVSHGCLYTFVLTYDFRQLSNDSVERIMKPREEHEKKFVWHFSTHVFIMSAGVFLNAGTSTLAYRILIHVRKSRVKWIHGFSGAISATLCIIGVVINQQGHNHFQYGYNPHSCVGYATVVCILIQFFGGFTAYISFRKFKVHVELAAFHRFFGYAAVFMIAFQSITGICAYINFFISPVDYGSFTGRTFLINGAGVFMIVASVLMITLIRGTRFHRRSRPEKSRNSGQRKASQESEDSWNPEDVGELARNSDDVHIEGAKIGEMYYGALIHQYKYQ